MKKTIKLYDLAGLSDQQWDDVQDILDVTTADYNFTIVEIDRSYEDQPIVWGDRVDDDKYYPSESWIYGFKSDGADVVVVYVSDKQMDTPVKNKLGGLYVGKHKNASYIFMCASTTKERARRLAHELGHAYEIDEIGQGKYEVHTYDPSSKKGEDRRLVDVKMFWHKLSERNLDTVVIVHHTGTPRDTTNINAIIKEHTKKYGRSFYQCFITSDGTVYWQHYELNQRTKVKSIDYCVVGDFTREKPTEAQLRSLSELLKGREYYGHKESTKFGATPSECPGNLVKHLTLYNTQKSDHRDLLRKLAMMVVDKFHSGKLPKDLALELLLLILNKLKHA